MLLAFGAALDAAWCFYARATTAAAPRGRRRAAGGRPRAARVGRAPAHAPGDASLTLPADVRGFFQVDGLRQDGGLREVDRRRQGRPRAPGPVLGVLESPEVDQQVAAAEADPDQATHASNATGSWSPRTSSPRRTSRPRARSTTSRARRLRQARRCRTTSCCARRSPARSPRATSTRRARPGGHGLDQSALPLVDVADLRPAAHHGVRAAGRRAVRARGDRVSNRRRPAARPEDRRADQPLRQGARSALAHDAVRDLARQRDADCTRARSCT